jgi:hypothetical protein
VAEPLTTDDLLTMERAARRFQGAFTGTSGTLAGYVILLLGEVRRLRVETAELRVAAAMKENEPPISYD